MNYAQFSDESKAALQTALQQWRSALDAAQLGQDEVTKQLERSVEQGVKTAPPPSVESTNTTSVTPASSSSTALPSLDSSSDKATKDTLFKVAGFLAEQDLAMPLSIRLKRFALWGNITSVPDHNPQGVTLLRGMSVDRIRDYQAQLAHADLALWRKVEQSLTMAPFWFEGQWMS
ncbi:type VI secretion system domain-containing protein, partial [Vibrio parahaemolyticus]|nr:type VI secretion system domain-containing protein [Vibrio parahaemolyticus]